MQTTSITIRCAKTIGGNFAQRIRVEFHCSNRLAMQRAGPVVAPLAAAEPVAIARHPAIKWPPQEHAAGKMQQGRRPPQTTQRCSRHCSFSSARAVPVDNQNCLIAARHGQWRVPVLAGDAGDWLASVTVLQPLPFRSRPLKTHDYSPIRREARRIPVSVRLMAAMQVWPRG